jgi:hypothetical protein
MKNKKYEKEIIQDFVEFINRDGIKLCRTIIPKWYEKLQGDENETTLINVNIRLDQVKRTDLEQRINLFISTLSKEV